MESVNFESLVEKWAPVLNEETAGPISDWYKKQVTAAILENQEQAMISENSQGSFLSETPANATGSVSNWDPVLISLVRRAMPNLMAYDVCGVQPMSGPTGLIFAMKSQYKTTVAGVTADDEALHNEAISPYSGDTTATQATGPSDLDVVLLQVTLTTPTSVVVCQLLMLKHWATLVTHSQRCDSPSRRQR